MAFPNRRKPGFHEQAWHYLLGLGPDLAFLQETLPPAWARTEGTLIHGPFKQWGSALFSPRYPLASVVLPQTSNLRALGNYLAFAEASLPDGTDAFLGSIHAPHGLATSDQLGNLDPRDVVRPSLADPHINDAVFAGLGELLSGRPSFIVAGDWNTGRTQGTVRGDRAGEEFFERASKRGWFDCVWYTLEHEVKTWFGRGKVIQDDHAFCDQSLGRRLVEGSIWAPREAVENLNLSDHAPLILDFEVESIGQTSRRQGAPPDPSRPWTP